MSNWKLVSDPVAFLDETGKRAWMSPGEKKQKKAIERIAKKACDRIVEKTFLDSELEISIDSELRVHLMPSEDLSSEYIIQNISQEWIGLIVGQCNLKKGVPVDSQDNKALFEFTVCPDYPDSLGLITEEMDDYESCFNEMIRQANCSSLKRTRSWKAGHRYDTENETIFCLGEVGSHKEAIYSDYIPLSAGKKAYLITTTIKGCKTISDVLKTQSFGEHGIQVRYSTPSMVDSGEQLVNDLAGKDISEYWDTMIDNSKGIIDLLDILAYSNNDPAPVSEKFKDILKKRIAEPAKNLVIRFWDLEGYTNDLMEIGKKKDPKINRRNLLNLVWKEVGDNNHLAPLYYTDLFLAYEINLDDLLDDIIAEYGNQKKIFSSWENYVERGPEYFKLHDLDTSKKKSNQRDKSLVGYYYSNRPKIETLEDIYGTGELTSALKAFFGEAISNEGLPATDYGKYNMGTRKSKNEYISVSVDFPTFVEWATNKGTLTKELKEEIILKKWRGTMLEIDAERDLK